jgi:methylisocitrate lyase
MAGKEVVERGEWLAKLRAALDHRDALFVTARTDARAPLGLAEAIDRGKAARDLGVDAVFVEAPESIDELAQIAAAIPDCVLVANMVETGRTPLLTPAELHDLGFDLVVSPLSGLFSAVHAMQRQLRELHDTGTLRDRLDELVAFDDFTALVELERHRALDERYPTH